MSSNLFSPQKKRLRLKSFSVVADRMEKEKGLNWLMFYLGLMVGMLGGILLMCFLFMAADSDLDARHKTDVPWSKS